MADASDWTHFTLYPRFVMPLIYQWSMTSLLCTACVARTLASTNLVRPGRPASSAVRRSKHAASMTEWILVARVDLPPLGRPVSSHAMSATGRKTHPFLAVTRSAVFRTRTSAAGPTVLAGLASWQTRAQRAQNCSGHSRRGRRRTRPRQSVPHGVSAPRGMPPPPDGLGCETRHSRTRKGRRGARQRQSRSQAAPCSGAPSPHGCTWSTRAEQ